MRSTSRLAVRMPDGDFFWNACSTYTAFSNRTVYTARYALPSCDSTISSTPGPRPFHGFAVGAVPPNCAMPRAFPTSTLTVAGKLRKSRYWTTRPDAVVFVGREHVAPRRLSQFGDAQASVRSHRGAVDRLVLVAAGLGLLRAAPATHPAIRIAWENQNRGTPYV